MEFDSFIYVCRFLSHSLLHLSISSRSHSACDLFLFLFFRSFVRLFYSVDAEFVKAIAESISLSLLSNESAIISTFSFYIVVLLFIYSSAFFALCPPTLCLSPVLPMLLLPNKFMTSQWVFVMHCVYAILVGRHYFFFLPFFLFAHTVWYGRVMHVVHFHSTRGYQEKVSCWRTVLPVPFHTHKLFVLLMGASNVNETAEPSRAEQQKKKLVKGMKTWKMFGICFHTTEWRADRHQPDAQCEREVT